MFKLYNKYINNSNLIISGSSKMLPLNILYTQYTVYYKYLMVKEKENLQIGPASLFEICIF